MAPHTSLDILSAPYLVWNKKGQNSTNHSIYIRRNGMCGDWLPSNQTTEKIVKTVSKIAKIVYTYIVMDKNTNSSIDVNITDSSS